MFPTDNILVIKLGGGEGLDLSQAVADIARVAAHRPVVVVHGTSARVNEMCRERGVPVQTLTSPGGHSSRYTNEETRDVYVEAARSVNTEIVDLLQFHTMNAIGLTNAAEVPLIGERKRALRAVVDGRVRIVRDDYSGTITQVNAAPILELLSMGYIPVILPMANSDDGFLNVDGDRASAAIASALGADELIILSNVPGLLRNVQDLSSLVTEIPRQQLPQAMNWAEGRMKRKILGAQEAIEGGVQRVRIGDGRISNPISQALSGEGTTFFA